MPIAFYQVTMAERHAATSPLCQLDLLVSNAEKEEEEQPKVWWIQQIRMEDLSSADRKESTIDDYYALLLLTGWTTPSIRPPSPGTADATSPYYPVSPLLWN